MGENECENNSQSEFDWTLSFSAEFLEISGNPVDSSQSPWVLLSMG